MANGQKWHFTVVQDKDMLDRMVKDVIEAVINSGNKFLADVVSRPNHHTFYHAPTVIIIAGDGGFHILRMNVQQEQKTF